MKNKDNAFTFVLSHFLTFLLLISCSFDPPSSAPRDNPDDMRNPNIVPEVLSISFAYRDYDDQQANIRIETRRATEVRFERVDERGDWSLHAYWHDVDTLYQIDLDDGEHLIGAQAKALNGNESTIFYASIQVVSAGYVNDFPLGNTGETIVMCWIPEGSFEMGSPDDEDGRDSDEGPVHRVTFTEGFWLGKYEVTQAQWEAVMGSNPSYFNGANHPVEQVSWEDIQDFESELDNVFRLPSEAEWEYSCRAGTTTRFYWGDDPNYSQIGGNAWYGGNSDSSTHPVGQKGANDWELHDMSGNVWEWCEDWYHSSYDGAPNDGSAWVTDSSSYRVVRGGGCLDPALYCRSAFRLLGPPSGRFVDLGFRLARDND